MLVRKMVTMRLLACFRFVNGKDIVNKVKKREWFRPFAGTILEEDVHEWFDLREMDTTPFMMYAVNCKQNVKEKIPAILHFDNTCRIQTINKKQNENKNLYFPEHPETLKTDKNSQRHNQNIIISNSN